MVESDSRVQPIVLLRAGTHEDAVRAVALASVTAYLQTADDPAWTDWLAARFTKTVRRAKAGLFAQITPLAAAHATVGEAQALALVPVSYDEMADSVRKCQVAGTELPRLGWPQANGHGPLHPQIAINEDLGMSTGKTAAQAAHGLFAWFLRLADADRAAWLAQGAPFGLTGLDKAAFAEHARDARVIINDAGFTEVTPGSATVIVR